ncbi:hypothetical protein N7448_003492 [Penicillium atrosanguineum]|uniref:Uncharacterized protein n=1 Tax=Penicillium atrosanguineum TaxID=1132637 RepID=A0A9W9L782_9EURO|nr:uncharacterized protein N7443_002461 [Penicillium atrosanguineum]KAJ5122358.1 hypothetical protein N7526_009295 [Penicillium atrosanguineum]KAJ5140084.1 hypothetical protein N7448_003492 [Penicillium atrosanguineum]KAJ5310000.1 hypothetical protein N7443_002461 [Penicillium atrosanguineum]KAJ5315518.1 hypothetical protein N7476_005825 [Penicillium atrosanguineum]
MGANFYSNGTGHGQPNSPFNDFQTNTASIPWAEIFSRHENVLSAHLEMLDSVKRHVAQDGEAFRAVSSMVNKTIQTMNQFKVVRKHMTHARQTPTPQSTDVELTSQRKRPRTEKERDTTTTESETTWQSEVPVSKRKRDITSHPVAEDFHHTSGSLETEDISEEVQRRLRIKEERRRQKDEVKPEKRKRESMVSNESTSPDNSEHRKKRVRTGHDSKRDGEITTETKANVKTRRYKKTR